MLYILSKERAIRFFVKWVCNILEKLLYSFLKKNMSTHCHTMYYEYMHHYDSKIRGYISFGVGSPLNILGKIGE